MTFTKLILSATLISGLTACAAATQEIETQSQAQIDATAQTVALAKTKTPYTTVKPGADVSLNSILPKNMVSGSYQTVRLRLSDGYSDGALSVRVEPSAGLRLFGGNDSKTFDMSKSGSHDFDVDVSADTDGVYFLNVFATANGSPRSFSVRLDIGQVTQKMFDDAMPADGELTDGGRIRALDATETIK